MKILPAKVIADNHIKFSTLDQEGVLSIAKSVNAELVISTCVDQANVTACYVGENLNCLSPTVINALLTSQVKLQ